MQTSLKGTCIVAVGPTEFLVRFEGPADFPMVAQCWVYDRFRRGAQHPEIGVGALYKLLLFHQGKLITLAEYMVEQFRLCADGAGHHRS